MMLIQFFGKDDITIELVFPAACLPAGHHDHGGDEADTRLRAYILALLKVKNHSQYIYSFALPLLFYQEDPAAFSDLFNSSIPNIANSTGII